MGATMHANFFFNLQLDLGQEDPGGLHPLVNSITRLLEPDRERLINLAPFKAQVHKVENNNNTELYF